MGKPTLTQVLKVHDPMLADNFDMVFEKVVGNPEGPASIENLTVQCKTAVKPGSQMAEVEVELFGHKVMHGAKRTWSNDMQIEFVEDANGMITKTMENWLEQIREIETQHGHFKKDYATNAKFTIYDQEGESQAEYKIHNIWPADVSELSFDGSGGQALNTQVSFKFDHVTREK